MWGYWNIIGSPFFKVERLFEGLGEVWHCQRADFKLYPTCACNHPGIEAINRLVQEHRIKTEEIEEILLQVSPLTITPNRTGMDLESFADTQFRNTYIFALAAYYGHSPSPAWQMPATFGNTRIKALMQKVKVELHPRASELASNRIKAGESPVFWNTTVEITAGGRKFSTEVSVCKGGPENPMTRAELLEKFRVNAAYSTLRSSKTEELIGVISQLERVDDITEFTELITLN